MKINDCKLCSSLEHCHVSGSKIGISSHPDYAFIGEAPGEIEAKEGWPFCGPSGQFLRKALDHINIKDYYLFNVLKCRPPENRDPTMNEIMNCIPFLSKQLDIYHPKTVVALGKIAHESLESLGVPHLQVVHPSYALRKGMTVEEYAFKISTALSSLTKEELPPSEPFISSLHDHTDFSIGDSIRSPAEMIERAKWGNMPVLALTDHGTLAGVYDFEDAALSAGMPYIIGYEAYVDYRPGKSGHMTIWVTSPVGWKNLIAIHNEGIATNHRKVTLNYYSLLNHSEGLILGSACIGGVISKILHEEGEEAAEAKIMEMSEALQEKGSALYLEVMPHIEVSISEEYNQVVLNKFYIKMSKKFGIPAIITIDTHYNKFEEKQFKMSASAMAFHDKSRVSSGETFKGNTYYFMAHKEVRGNLRLMRIEDSDIDTLIKNTEELAKQLAGANFRLPREFATISIGAVDFKEDLYIKYEEFKNRRLEGVSEEIIKAYDARIKMEYDRIKRKGFEWYFKIESKFVEELRTQKIPVGIARGSAGGSLVAYVMGITKLDPIKYDLLFDRFLSEERNDPPDIDIDVATSYRSKAIQILSEILGTDEIAGIMDYTRWKKDGAERDVCWLLDIDIHDYRQGLIQDQQAVDLQNAIIGHIKYRSTHASGFIAYDNLRQNFPLAKISKDKPLPSVEYELSTLGRLGIAKFDVLGLTELDNIYMFDGEEQPILAAMEDAEILDDRGELFIEKISNVKDLLQFAIDYPIGLFQIKTASGNRAMKDINPQNFEELVHVIALNRPGPRDSGMIDLYRRRKGGEPYEPMPSTEKTYGCPIFQEQILMILNKVFGMSLGEADEVRRYISKKKMDKLTSVQNRLSEALQDKGNKEIWDQVMNWANYGFNRAHAVAYASLAMMTIWAKYNLPSTFYAHFMNLEDDPALLREALREAHRLDIQIVRPNLQYPHGKGYEKFSRTFYDGEKIILGLNLIKGLGEKNSTSLAKKLAQKGPAGLTEKRLALVKRAGYWGEPEEPFVSFSLPVEDHQILPWYEYKFGNKISNILDGEDFKEKLIVFEDKDKIMKIEDNSGSYYLRTSRGDGVTKDELKTGILDGHFLKSRNNQIILLERNNKIKLPISHGYRVLYVSAPRQSKKGNYYSIVVLKNPAPEGKVVECVIVGNEENLKHLSSNSIIHGSLSESYFSWDIQRDLQSTTPP